MPNYTPRASRSRNRATPTTSSRKSSPTSSRRRSRSRTPASRKKTGSSKQKTPSLDALSQKLADAEAENEQLRLALEKSQTEARRHYAATDPSKPTEKPVWELFMWLNDHDSEQLNALTSAAPAFLALTGRIPTFEASVAILIFSAVAALVHMMPGIPRSTHWVKAAFTPVAMFNLHPGVQVAVTLVSLVPYFMKSAAKLEAIGGTVRQASMGYFLYLAFMADSIHWAEIAVMFFCKVIYRRERSARIKAGTREKFGILHAFEHIDVYLFILCAYASPSSRPEEWKNLAYLTAASLCIALAPFKSGDAYRACVGVLLILYSDWQIYKTGWLAACATIVYCKSRGANPKVFFSWSRRQGLYTATLATSGYILHSYLGMNGFLFGMILEGLFLLMGVHEQRPDLWSTVWYCVILASLAEYPVHFGIGVIAAFADLLDLRFMGNLQCGVHLFCLGLYAYRGQSLTPLAYVWLSSAVGFLAINLSIGLFRSKPPKDFPEDLLPFWKKKINGNAFAINPIGYFLKPYSTLLSWERVSWKGMEKDIGKIDWQGFEPDLVVGVLSGGGFIQHLVAKHFPDADRAIIRSQVWSRLTIKENLKSVGQVFTNKDEWRSSKPKFLAWQIEPPQLSSRGNRRILVVDDSVSTGKTLTNVIKMVKQDFPDADVRTFVLYAPEDNSETANTLCSLDYIIRRGRVPMIWPWGVEMD